MTKDKKIEVLKNCFEEVIWMAIRYAHGRHTYAPSMVRDAVTKYKQIFPGFVLKEDITIKSPDEAELNAFKQRSDYLDDLFINSKND